MPLQGASNFRDLGGCIGDGGRRLRWRRLFRAEHLAGLTDAQPGGISGFLHQRLGLDAAALGLLAARYLATA